MDRYARGSHEFRELVGGDPATALAAIRRQSPEMFQTLIETGFAGQMTRAELSRQWRELATVAMLAAIGGAEPQLATHVHAALRNGVSPDELRALAEHVTGYAGFPRGLNALRVIDEAITAADLPAPAGRRAVRLPTHDTQVASRGESGPPVLLIHAIGLDWRMWDAVMEPLSRGRRVYAYDVRGHGAASDTKVSTMDELADDATRILDALDIDTAHVVGLSYGGGIAQALAVGHRDRLASLALLGTTDTVFDAFAARAAAAETETTDTRVATTLPRWFTTDALALNEFPVRYAREHLRRALPTDFAGAWRAFQTLDVRDRLADLAVPVLVAAGENDVSCPPELMRAIAERIPGSVYKELAGAPHMMSLQSPDTVAAALEEFLPAES
ncbi:MAG TPA: alpha/beta fold hydrolase [Stackebrandtia sp.]|uniref:alpha/beta fold hydrolase n=1 Tax=Stackebrandtia sp. TaxID=2023065 RepID=UPI002D5BCA30|nr:alpha/beta fold hydrolase [Stackebrandtia sp.]HZE40586.1 alpha/beta fold hydrolase [Stackebrandtia sp.]